MTSTRPIRKQPIRRTSHRATPSRLRRLGWRGRLLLSSILLILVLICCGVAARFLAPTSNTSLTHFDAIIVLGTPADSDGNPTPRQLDRVTEGVREYERGVAPRLIMTGGAAHNGFVEARVMARTAHAQGIPESAIFIEPQAKDTIQNACYSARIMRERGWRSAEVVSSASHLPRAGYIFNEMPIQWRTHAAPSLEPEPSAYPWASAYAETVLTVRYLVWARWRETCLP
ncbi:MAG TPA: YdcF family protein [Terracidiphilus sp.]|nr:YdcF family protein [Terracidiphilus sp.]